MAIAFSTHLGQGKWHDNIKYGSGKWPLKRYTFRGLSGSPKASSITGNKIYGFFFAKGRRLALNPARVMKSRSSALGLRIPSTFWPLVGRRGAGLWIRFSLHLLDKHTAKWDCFASRYQFPDISEILLNIAQLFYLGRFSMRIISSADCLPVYHYNYQICILFTQTIDILVVVCRCPAFVRCWVRPCDKIRPDYQIR